MPLHLAAKRAGLKRRILRTIGTLNEESANLYMDAELFVVGIVVAVIGATLLATTRWFPQDARRERRRVRKLALRAQEEGLRGRFEFANDPGQRGPIGGSDTYEPADAEDRALFTEVGSRTESEAAFFANEMLWSDRRFVWVGLPFVVIGVAASVLAVFG